MTLPTPRYHHDCDKCKYLGQTIGGGKIHDLYACFIDDPADPSPTLLARYSDDGPDYYSCNADLVRANGHAELFVALHLWVQA